MDPSHLTADEAVLECLAIVEQCAGATAPGRYGDGYRAAAANIRSLIEARFGRRPIEAWEQDLHDTEVEARALARVIGVIRREQTRSSSAAIRRVLGDLIATIDDGESEPSASSESCVQLTRSAG